MSKSAKLLITDYRCTGDFCVREMFNYIEFSEEEALRFENFIREKGIVLGKQSNLYYHPPFPKGNNDRVLLRKDANENSLFRVTAKALADYFEDNEYDWVTSKYFNEAAVNYLRTLHGNVGVFVYFG